MLGILWVTSSGLLITDSGNKINILILIFSHSFYKWVFSKYGCIEWDSQDAVFSMKTEDRCCVS